MNSSAPEFFSITKIALFDELILTLNRLTDKPNTYGNDNASLEQLIERIDSGHNTDLVSTLKIKLENIRTNYSAFRILRHKRVAHNDLLTALGKDRDILPGITRGQAEAAIKDITELMNEFSENTMDTTLVYKPFLIGYGDGNALMQTLKRIDS